MDIKVIEEKMLFNSKKDVLKLHLYSKLINKGIRPYDNDLNILVSLYEKGGYNNKQEQYEFFNTCIENKYKRTIQSIRNTLSKYTEMGILERPRNETRYLSTSYIPQIQADRIVLDYKISHN